MTDLQIQYFLKVADCMSFSGAARDLFVSQPSVSRQIRQLEQELGCELFDRSCKNAVSLTPAGAIFRDSFQRLLREHQAALSAAWEVSRGPAERLRIGIGENWDLAAPLMRFRERALARDPHTELLFEQAPFLALRDLLAAGRLDAIVCTRTSVQSFEGVELIPVGEMRTSLFVRRGLLCPPEQTPRLSDFDGQTLLMLPDDEAPMAMQIVLLQFLAEQVKPKVRRMTNRASIWQAIRMGEGFCAFDDRVLMRHDPLICRVDLDETIPICVVWKRQNQSPLFPVLAEELQKTLAVPVED